MIHISDSGTILTHLTIRMNLPQAVSLFFFLTPRLKENGIYQLQVAPPTPPMYQPPAMASAVPPCPMSCKRNCFTYCPRECCGVAGKRDKVIPAGGSGSEETADQAETDQNDNGNGNEAVEESEGEKMDAKQPVEDNEKIEEQSTAFASEEGSSNNDGNNENIENDD